MQAQGVLARDWREIACKRRETTSEKIRQTEKTEMVEQSLRFV